MNRIRGAAIASVLFSVVLWGVNTPRRAPPVTVSALQNGEGSGNNRQLGVLPNQPVCVDGEFTPSASRYYTISDGSKIWTFDASSEIDIPLKATGSMASTSSHWRFVKDGSLWLLKNRLTGSFIAKDSSLRLITSFYAEAPTKFSATCASGGGVIFRDASSTSLDAVEEQRKVRKSECRYPGLLDSCSDYFGPEYKKIGREKCGLLDNKRKLVCMRSSLVTPARSVSTKYTSCKFPKLLDSCSASFGSGWTQISYHRCGWRNKKRKRKCQKVGGGSNPPWTVQEVSQYKAADIKNAPLVNLQSPNKVLQVTEDILAGAAAVSSLVALTGPIGATVAAATLMANVIVGLFTDSDEDALVTLAQEMLEVALYRIDEVAVQETIREAVNEIDVIHSQIMTYQTGRKGRYMKAPWDGQTLHDLRYILLEGIYGYGEDIELALSKLYPDSYVPTSLNLRRAQSAWPILKMVTSEMLLLFQETVLLDAFITATYDEPTSCEDIWDTYGLSQRVLSSKRMLQNTQDMLLEGRLKDSTLEYVEGLKRCRPTIPGNTAGDIVGFKERIGVKDSVRDIAFMDTVADLGVCSRGAQALSTFRNGVKEELGFDMIHLSYPLFDEMSMLDSFQQDTMYLCEAMMIDPAVREAFVPEQK